MYDTARIINAKYGAPLPSNLDAFYRKAIRNSGPKDNIIHRIRPEVVFYDNLKPFYRLYPALAEALLTTKINIPVGEINMPFKSFVVNLHSDLHIPAPIIEDGPSEICSFMVNMLSEPSGHRQLAINYQTKIRKDLLTPEGIAELEMEVNDSFSYESNYIIDPDSYYLEFPFIEGSTLEECYQQYVADRPDSKRPTDVHLRLLKLAVGVIFLAVSQDKRYVRKVINRIKNNEQCFCGSGKKYKRCCKLRGIQNVGYDIGKDIILATEQKPGMSTVVEGRGKQLRYGHMRTGHMRWQWYNDEEGMRQRKLIFIHPSVVRADLPMKPGLTPRAIRRPKPRYYRNPFDDYCTDC